MKWVTLVSEDRVGLLADVSYILGKSNLSIESLSVDVLGGRAVISMQVRDSISAADILNKNGFMTTLPEAVIVKVARDGFEEVSKMLKSARVKMHKFQELSSDTATGVFALHVDKPRRASRVLEPFLFGNCVTGC